jgi:shikimate kinase
VDRPLVLVGLPGSGKSTVGPLVAEALGVPFVDLDRVIEAEAGKSVARIFEEEGEGAFRAMEARLGAGVLAGPPCVLAPGGGYFLDADLRRRTLASSLVVYLATAPAEAARRLGSSQDRPLLRGYVPALRLRLLLEQREPLYREAQQLVTTDGRTPSEVAAELVELARGVRVR